MSGWLHVLAESPWAGAAFKECLSLIRDGDGVLMVGEGCYGACAAALPLWPRELNIAKYAYDLDVDLRGVSVEDGIVRVDGDDMLRLVVDSNNVTTWLP